MKKWVDVALGAAVVVAICGSLAFAGRLVLKVGDSRGWERGVSECIEAARRYEAEKPVTLAEGILVCPTHEDAAPCQICRSCVTGGKFFDCCEPLISPTDGLQLWMLMPTQRLVWLAPEDGAIRGTIPHPRDESMELLYAADPTFLAGVP